MMRWRAGSRCHSYFIEASHNVDLLLIHEFSLANATSRRVPSESIQCRRSPPGAVGGESIKVKLPKIFSP